MFTFILFQSFGGDDCCVAMVGVVSGLAVALACLLLNVSYASLALSGLLRLLPTEKNKEDGRLWYW